MIYSYQWDEREKAWVVINVYGRHNAVFMDVGHAEVWTKLMNGQAVVVEKEQPKLGD